MIGYTTKMPSRMRAGARNRYGVNRCRRITGPRGPGRRCRTGAIGRGRYFSVALAWATASESAFWASTPPNRADSMALRTISLTSALLGTVGTMSAYVAMMSFASGRALSSTAAGVDEKNGSSYADGLDGYTATCFAKSTMLRGLVKNWASAIEAFGNFVSPFTDRDMRPLPATLLLPSGCWTMPRLSYR